VLSFDNADDDGSGAGGGGCCCCCCCCCCMKLARLDMIILFINHKQKKMLKRQKTSQKNFGQFLSFSFLVVGVCFDACFFVCLFVYLLLLLNALHFSSLYNK